MKNSRKPLQLYDELMDVAGKLFSDLRKEEGLFKTGSCTVNGQRVMVVNKRQPIEERIEALAKEIALLGAENHYLKPVVRAEVERYSLNPDVVEVS